MKDKIQSQGITFDDVLLEPRYSEVIPADVRYQHPADAKHQAQYPAVELADGHGHRKRMAIALAQEGGIGVIHKNMSIEAQTDEVDKVKRSENGIITDPVTLPPDETVAKAREIMAQHHVSGVPITTVGPAGGHPHPARPALPRRQRQRTPRS